MADITDDERKRRIDAAMAEANRLRNTDAPREVYWLSFVDDDGFLGAAIVDDCVNPADAIQQSHRKHCNPGGQVAFHVLPPEAFDEDETLRDAPRNVLMSKAELLRRKLITVGKP